MYKNFIKLDNWTVWGSKEEKNYIQKYGDKIVALLIFLDIETNNRGIAKTTIEEIITNCFGLTPKAGKGKINEKTIRLLSKMKEDNIIECDANLDNIKPTEMLKIKVKDTIEKDEQGSDIQYYSLDYKMYDCIMSHNCKVNNITMLNIYCYISARLRRHKSDYGITENTFVYGDGHYHKHIEEEGRVEATFFIIDEALKDLEVSKPTFIEGYKELEKMGLVYVINIGSVKKGEEVKQASNVYVLDKKYIKFAEEESIYYYKENGYEILKYEVKEDKSKKRNRLKYLKRKINNKKANEKEIEEYNSLINCFKLH